MIQLNFKKISFINLKNAGFFLVVIASILAGMFISYKLCILFAPFLIAFILSSLMEPIIKYFNKKFHVNRKLAAFLLLIVFIFILLSLLVLLISRLINELKSIAYILPEFLSSLYNNTNDLINNILKNYEWLPPEILENISRLVANLSNYLLKLADSIIKGAFATAVSVPEALIFVLVTFLSAYFISSDRDKIYRLLKKQLPQSWFSKVSNVKKSLFSVLIGYMKAVLILMLITFIQLLIGFLFIHIKYALLLALLISFIDALPILGTGSILIPWALYDFITGDIRQGTSLIILYLIVLMVRQIIEPKIVGRQIGVHPLLTLVAMYAGLKLAGFAGLILGPIIYIIAKSILSGIYKNKSLKDILK